MDLDRWKQLDSLLQSVLERPFEERDAFLRQACAGDEPLERQVHTLLSTEPQAKAFLERPGIYVAALGLARDLRDNASECADSLIGQALSHYRIVEKLGSGGMGVVYKAEDTRLHRFVALKLLTDELAYDREALSRFQREARTASALNHPNICTIYDVGEQDGRSFIAMEYLEGSTLKERIREHRCLDMDTLLTLGIEIADALDAAHSAGVIHRDIKPANLFISPRGHAKILDFGLAKMGGPIAHPADSPTLNSTATQNGTLLGTAAYMAPEQARGEAVDHRADIWALGLVLYEIAVGARPVAAVRLRVEKSPELERIISKCLETDRELRYQNASDVCTDLQRLKRDSGSAHARSLSATRPKRWKMLLPAASAAALMLLVAGYANFHHAPSLTDRDTIVLADFENKTGDPVFDDTLRQGLSVDLQQSPFLSLVSDERIRRTLLLMNLPANARLTPEIAQGVCVRTASAAVLEGSIAVLGSQYVLGLRAKNCTTGDVLADEQAQAARKESVLGALSQTASRFRTRVGESLATIERHSMPLEEATTPSLEALQAYSTASKVFLSSGAVSSLPLFTRAISLDADFAIAHAYLGISYSVLGESTLARQSTLTAYQLRERASDAERFFIDTFYQRQVTGNVERLQQTLQSWAQTYPRDPRPHRVFAGLATRSTGQYERSIEEADKAIALDPDEVQAYRSKAFSELSLNRLADTEVTIRRAAERKLEIRDSLLVQYFIAFLNGDDEEMRRKAALAKGNPFMEDMIAHVDALVLARSGRLQDARRTSAVAVDIAKQTGQRERAALFEAATAVAEALYGNVAGARRRATDALELARGRDSDYAAAFSLAIAGDLTRARALADDLKKSFPEDTSVRFIYLPTLRALFALRAADPVSAIQYLQPSSRFDLALGGIGFNGFFGAPYPAYVRGAAYLAAHQPASAAAEFQRILDHRSIVLVDPMDAVARLQLARALALAGDTEKAKSAYNDLFTLWKNADSEIPVVNDALAEYAKLP
jgi:serine/threonine protein kinase/tetratricopeptide (TPR) repeat protein